MVLRWAQCVSLAARAFPSTWVQPRWLDCGKRTPPHFHNAASESVRNGGDDRFVANARPPGHSAVPGRPRATCGITTLGVLVGMRPPPAGAQGEGLYYGSRSGRPFPLPWDPRTAGESSGVPRTSGAGSQKCNRKEPGHFGFPHCGRHRAATASEAGARGLLWPLLGDRVRKRTAGEGPGGERERCAQKESISANVTNPRRGKRVKLCNCNKCIAL